MSLHRALASLRRAERVLVAVDFDGTLSPLVEHPAEATPHPRARALLERLTASAGTEVLVISGRALADLEERIGSPVEGIELVGEHGNDAGGTSDPHPDIEEFRRWISSRAELPSGLHVEDKPRSVAIHYRSVAAEEWAPLRDDVDRWLDTRPDVNLLEGKKVIEVAAGDASKGGYVRDRLAGFDHVVYFGDDVTDETVFEVLRSGDIGVKVGPGSSRARFRLQDVDQVMDALDLLAEARE